MRCWRSCGRPIPPGACDAPKDSQTVIFIQPLHCGHSLWWPVRRLRALIELKSALAILEIEGLTGGECQVGRVWRGHTFAHVKPIGPVGWLPSGANSCQVSSRSRIRRCGGWWLGLVIFDCLNPRSRLLSSADPGRFGGRVGFRPGCTALSLPGVRAECQ